MQLTNLYITILATASLVQAAATQAGATVFTSADCQGASSFKKLVSPQTDIPMDTATHTIQLSPGKWLAFPESKGAGCSGASLGDLVSGWCTNLNVVLDKRVNCVRKKSK